MGGQQRRGDGDKCPEVNFHKGSNVFIFGDRLVYSFNFLRFVICVAVSTDITEGHMNVTDWVVKTNTCRLRTLPFLELIYGSI